MNSLSRDEFEKRVARASIPSFVGTAYHDAILDTDAAHRKRVHDLDTQLIVETGVVSIQSEELAALRKENADLRRDLPALASESVKRDLALAKIEAEVVASRGIVKDLLEKT